MSGYIKGYGKVQFDIANYDNNVYDLYSVVACDDNLCPMEAENYVNVDDYWSSLRNTYDRELVYEDVTCGTCQVFDSCGDSFICDCDYHIAYVIDHES